MNTLALDFDVREPKSLSCRFRDRYDDHHERPQGGGMVYSGKKAVKRIAFLAQDMIHRFYLGSTRLSDLIRTEEGISDEESDEGEPPYGSEESMEEPDGEGGVETRRVIKASVSDVNGREQSVGQPNGREGVGAGFEVFMRMAALFKYEAAGHLRYGSHDIKFGLRHGLNFATTQD